MKPEFGNTDHIDMLKKEKLEENRKERECKECHGDGFVITNCFECDGTGEIEEDCKECEGRGEIEPERN